MIVQCVMWQINSGKTRKMEQMNIAEALLCKTNANNKSYPVQEGFLLHFPPWNQFFVLGDTFIYQFHDEGTTKPLKEAINYRRD